MTDMQMAKDWAWLIGLASPVLVAAAMWWLSQRFATRGELAAIGARLDTMEDRLDHGEQRFGRLEGAISAATAAAEAATRAADRAADAAAAISDVRVDTAQLRGELTAVREILLRVEQNAGLMLRGHLRLGEKA